MFKLLPLLFLIVGCSSLTPKEKGNYSVPQSLPKEDQEKYEITDVPKPKKEKSKVPAKKNKVIEISSYEKSLKSRSVDLSLIKPYEYIKYEVSALGFSAGTMTMSLVPGKLIDNRPVYHLKSSIVSKGMINTLGFKINDLIESFVDQEKFFSYRYQLNAEEGKIEKEQIEIYDSEMKKTYFWKKETRDGETTERKETFELSPFPQDLLSVFYFIRTLDLSSHPKILVTSQEKNREIELKSIGEEKVNSKIGSIDCFIISLQLEPDKPAHTIWISKDKKVIIQMEAKTKIGSIKSKITELRYGP